MIYSSNRVTMDISEVLEATVKALYYFAALALVIAGLYFGFRSRRLWIRIVLFLCSTLLVVVTALALWFDFYLMAGSTMHRPAIYSPDGKIVAVISWTLSGAVGFDHVHVRLRSRCSPVAKEVFTGLAQNPPDEPEVLWIDNQHLLISYWKDGHIEKCDKESRAILGVDVLCRE